MIAQGDIVGLPILTDKKELEEWISLNEDTGVVKKIDLEKGVLWIEDCPIEISIYEVTLIEKAK
jgi:hypothetical protein